MLGHLKEILLMFQLQALETSNALEAGPIKLRKKCLWNKLLIKVIPMKYDLTWKFWETFSV